MSRKATTTAVATETRTEARTRTATALAGPVQQAVPKTLRDGRFEVERVLGEGALGRTYLAWDTEGKRRKVAIKELQPGRLKTWKDLELFEREAQTLASLDHRGVPDYIDHFEVTAEDEAPRYYLVQEFIDGQTLEAELADKTVLSEAEVRKLAEEVLSILTYLHTLNPPVIHRDIKPSNLIRRPNGEVVLIDFGAVREVLDASASEEGSTLVGTFGYMPPEQYAGQAFRQTDLFALGATCAHLLTGRAPERLFGDLFHIELPDDVRMSLGFKQWLYRLLEPDLKRRYQTAEAALADLREGFLMRTEGTARSGAKLPEWPGRPPRRRPGFHYRDPSRGISHTFAIWLSVFAAVVTLALPVTAFAVAQPVWALFGVPMMIAATVIAVSRIRSAQDALDLYPRAEYTIGEVTRAFLGDSNDAEASLERRFLEFRYVVDGTYYTGHLTTSHKTLCQLRSGDAIALLIDPDAPDKATVFVG